MRRTAFRFIGIILPVLISCETNEHRPTLLDSMPEGYDVYLTFNPEEIGMEEVLSGLADGIYPLGENLVEVEDILGFTPLDWNGWVNALALGIDGEIGLIIDFDRNDIVLIAVYMSSDSTAVVEQFYTRITEHADDSEILFTESGGYTIAVIAHSSTVLEQFEESLGNRIDSDESFNRFREKSSSDLAAAELFVRLSEFSEQDDIESLLITCSKDGTILKLNLLALITGDDAIRYSSIIASEPNGDDVNIPSDISGALRISFDMETLKSFILSEGLNREFEPGMEMFGFGSVEELLDAFSGDTYFALNLENDEYAGVLEYGLTTTGAVDQMLSKIYNLFMMSGGYDLSSFDFQGSTCYGIKGYLADGIDATEFGVFDDMFVIAGGFTLQDVAEGISFENYIASSGLGMENSGGLMLVADVEPIAAIMGYNRQLNQVIDFGNIGYIALSVDVNDGLIVMNAALDTGEDNPFFVISNALVLAGSRMLLPEPGHSTQQDTLSMKADPAF